MKSFFINEAFDKAFNDYLISKDKPESVLYNSFLVVVIRLLISIYGEVDIINLFKEKNEFALDNNLMKYGASKEDINNLKQMISEYYLIERKNVTSIKREHNPYFIDIQKKLIDLFTLKRLKFDLAFSDINDFFDLLYTPKSSDALRQSYNFLNAENIHEVAEYYKECMKKEKISKDKDEAEKLLDLDVYKLFDLSIADINKMHDDEINSLNSEIYRTFDISENAVNKEEMLQEKIRELKIQSSPITTGNGYVDVLLIMSVIVTSIMVVIIFGTIVF